VRSGRIWLLSSSAEAAGQLVLKLRPTAAEARGLTLLAARSPGIAVPRPVAWTAEAAGAVIAGALGARGAPPTDLTGLCMGRLDGRTLGERLDAGSAIPVVSLAQAMVALHRLPLPPSLPTDPGPQAWLASRAAEWAEVAAGPGAADLGPLLSTALHRLALLAEGNPNVVLCHGDWAPGHILVHRGSVSGVVGWKALRAAPAASDLATAVTGLFAAGVSARAALALGDGLLRAYAAAAGTPPAAAPFYLLAEATRRTIEAARGRTPGSGPGAAAAWGGLLGCCLTALPD